MDKLPKELLINIITKLESVEKDREDNSFFFNIEIDSILKLRLINKDFNDIIIKLKGSWKYIPYKKYSIDYSPILFTNVDRKYINVCKTRSNEVSRFCSTKDTPTSTFKWLMDNNIFFSLPNICELIKNNRLDVIHLGYHYSDFLNMLFNRFYMNNEILRDNNYIFTSTHSLNPIIVAAENNHVSIIKSLLESSSIANPFIKEIPNIFDIAIKFCYNNLVNYIIINHYSEISELIDNKVLKIIHRFDDCQDIIFYLILNKKIKITLKLLTGCIYKSYNKLFKCIYDKSEYDKIDCNELIKKTVEYNNYTIFSYLINNTDYVLLNHNRDNFTRSLIKKKNIQKEFLEYVLLNHIELLSENYELVRFSIYVGVDNNVVQYLIENGFSYNKDDLYKPLDDENIELLKYLVNNL